jgi:hypothetical protein
LAVVPPASSRASRKSSDGLATLRAVDQRALIGIAAQVGQLSLDICVRRAADSWTIGLAIRLAAKHDAPHPETIATLVHAAEKGAVNAV